MDFKKGEWCNTMDGLYWRFIDRNRKFFLKNLCVEIKTDSWDMPKVFKWLKEEGDISNRDMFRIFNCGIGMVLIVDKNDVKDISNKISEMNFKNYVIGAVKEKKLETKYLFLREYL